VKNVHVLGKDLKKAGGNNKPGDSDAESSCSDDYNMNNGNDT